MKLRSKLLAVVSALALVATAACSCDRTIEQGNNTVVENQTTPNDLELNTDARLADARNSLNESN